MTIETIAITIDDYSRLRQHLPSKDRWIFRGQAHEAWPLATRMERHSARFPREIGAGKRWDAEQWMLREIKRHAHLYTDDAPAEDANLEWLALMQHHGAATRLLDWTFSEYVALFFALRDAVIGGACAVWAVNQKMLWEDLKTFVSPENQERLRENDKHPLVVSFLLNTTTNVRVAPLNPMRLSARLGVQQGTFLVPLSPEQSFEDNLTASLRGRDGVIRKFVIQCPEEEVVKGLTFLQRVNISHLSLFQGLDGLAASLNERSVLEHIRTQR
jgi:hypothetical protein